MLMLGEEELTTRDDALDGASKVTEMGLKMGMRMRGIMRVRMKIDEEGGGGGGGGRRLGQTEEKEKIGKHTTKSAERRSASLMRVEEAFLLQLIAALSRRRSCWPWGTKVV